MTLAKSNPGNNNNTLGKKKHPSAAALMCSRDSDLVALAALARLGETFLADPPRGSQGAFVKFTPVSLFLRWLALEHGIRSIDQLAIFFCGRGRDRAAGHRGLFPSQESILAFIKVCFLCFFSLCRGGNPDAISLSLSSRASRRSRRCCRR
jgi:hypothetical protein